MISAIELESSSDAVAAVRTCSDAVSEAPADLPDRPAVVRAVSVSCRATRSNSPEELRTLSRMVPTLVWNSSTKPRSSDCAARRRLRQRSLFLAQATAFNRVVLEDGNGRAISPISSIRSWQSISTSVLPLAITVSEAVTEVSGLVTRRTSTMVSSITSSAAMPAAMAMFVMACDSMVSNCAIGMPT